MACSVSLTNMSDFAEMNEAHASWWHLMTRTRGLRGLLAKAFRAWRAPLTSLLAYNLRCPILCEVCVEVAALAGTGKAET